MNYTEQTHKYCYYSGDERPLIVAIGGEERAGKAVIWLVKNRGQYIIMAGRNVHWDSEHQIVYATIPSHLAHRRRFFVQLTEKEKRLLLFREEKVISHFPISPKFIFLGKAT